MKNSKIKQINPLAEELKFFHKNKAQYLKTYKNKYVLIKKQEFIGSYDTEQDAYTAAVNKFGNEEILIKQILNEEVETSYPSLMLGLGTLC